MARTIVHCLAYNTPEMVKEALENYQLRGSMPHAGVERYLVDPGFPLMAAEPQSIKLRELAEDFGWTYLRMPQNYGVAGNWNWLMFTVGVGRNDVVIGADPDARPQQPGWLSALEAALRDTPDAAYVGLNHGLDNLPHELVGEKPRLMKFDRLVAWSVGGFHGRFLEKINFELGQDNLSYGYIEHWCHRKMKNWDMEFYLLRDFYDHHQSSEPIYQEWKTASAEKKTQASFEDWLKKLPKT